MQLSNITKCIVVNATGLHNSGGLTILRQFLDHAANYSEKKFICFVPFGMSFENVPSHVSIIPKDTKRWATRIYWDACGLKLELNRRGIVPDWLISLQNTSVNFDCSQIIYLHQPLPFVDYKFSPLKRSEFKSYLYSKFYLGFIKLFLKENSIFVVQTNWMKEALASKNFVNRVVVIKPNINLPSSDKSVSEHPLVFLYPATPLFYKNHLFLVKVLSALTDDIAFNSVVLQVTFSLGDYPEFDILVQRLSIAKNICYLGYLDQTDLYQKYQECSAVVFPSFIETFGLPLAEAASFSKFIFAPDLPYAREVLSSYFKVVFCDHRSELDWVKALKRYSVNKEAIDGATVAPFKMDSNWEDFFKLLD